MTDVTVAYISATCTPQEEKIYTSSRVRRGNSARLSPKIWWIVGKASNPQTPNDAQQVIAGASVPTTCLGAVPKRDRLGIGVSLPRHDNESHQARDGALRDVNAPSHDQGNKASSKETCGPRAYKRENRLQFSNASAGNSWEPPKSPKQKPVRLRTAGSCMPVLAYHANLWWVQLNTLRISTALLMYCGNRFGSWFCVAGLRWGKNCRRSRLLVRRCRNPRSYTKIAAPHSQVPPHLAATKLESTHTLYISATELSYIYQGCSLVSRPLFCKLVRAKNILLNLYVLELNFANLYLLDFQTYTC